MPHHPIDLTRVRTYPLAQRHNLVCLADLVDLETPPPPFDSPEEYDRRRKGSDEASVITWHPRDIVHRVAQTKSSCQRLGALAQ